MGGPREEFLSEEDLDLRNMTDEEIDAWWNLWFRLAQATNDLDEATYSHGVFDRDPAVDRRRAVNAGLGPDTPGPSVPPCPAPAAVASKTIGIPAGPGSVRRPGRAHPSEEESSCPKGN